MSNRVTPIDSCGFEELSKKIGAGRRIRTDDLLITNQLLYQLSYAGKLTAENSPKSSLREQLLSQAQ
jgi:hypothetical protein